MLIMIDQLKSHLWMLAAVIASGLFLLQTEHLYQTQLTLATERTSWAQANSMAMIKARQAEASHTETLNQALLNESTRATQNRIAADRARAERDGLRNQIASARSAIPHAAEAAIRAYAAAATDVFDQCTARYIDVAAAADGHASDALMLQQAWPQE